MDRSAVRARASESGLEAGRGGEGEERRQRGERIEVGRGVKREETGAEGACGPKKTKGEKEVKEDGSSSLTSYLLVVDR